MGQSLANDLPRTGPTITQGFFSHRGEFSGSLDHDGGAANCEVIKNVYPISSLRSRCVPRDGGQASYRCQISYLFSIASLRVFGALQNCREIPQGGRWSTFVNYRGGVANLQRSSPRAGAHGSHARSPAIKKPTGLTLESEGARLGRGWSPPTRKFERCLKKIVELDTFGAVQSWPKERRWLAAKPRESAEKSREWGWGTEFPFSGRRCAGRGRGRSDRFAGLPDRFLIRFANVRDSLAGCLPFPRWISSLSIG